MITDTCYSADIIPDLASRRVILMCGISGSGKTYFARNLERYGFIRVSADAIIWDKYGSAIDSLSSAMQMEVFRAADDEILEIVLRMLKDGKRVVVDSTMCKRSKRDAMRRACALAGTEPLLVYLEASLSTLSRRLESRRGVGPDDLIVPLSRLHSFVSNFQPPQSDEPHIVIPQ